MSCLRQELNYIFIGLFEEFIVIAFFVMSNLASVVIQKRLTLPQNSIKVIQSD